ncbi:GNAT family N-acetyltransferase [Halorientalis salina]|uniref:GNAT family N-acetyltransferase n=1 Tax=Halorientalis salina TaxID=2932266 RepID=UPI0010AC4F9B|nr:GNAT family N-acetyltransferase [Halorientalis salina]
MSDISFRRATPADAGEILGIKRTAIEELEHWQYSPEQIQAWAPKESYRDTFEQAIDDEQFVVHVAEAAGTIVGYGALNVPSERIDAVYVHPDHHGNGIATVLVKHLELSAEFQGVLELDIMAARNAVPFYRSVGYWRLDAEVTTIDDVDLEFVRMRKRLDETDPDEWFDADFADLPAEPAAWVDTDAGEDGESFDTEAADEGEGWFTAKAVSDPDEWFGN